MIDFVKLIHRHPRINDFIQMHKEHIYEQVHTTTGEILPNLKFKKGFYSTVVKRNFNHNHGYVFIEGSLHKSYFKGENYQRFNFGMIREEIEHLQELYGIRSASLDIQNIEIGVNVETAFSPIKHLSQNLLLYKTKPFIAYRPGADGKTLGYHCPGFPEVKMYDKGYQYNLKQNLLRIEVKHKKSTVIQKLGVHLLSDLSERSKLGRLGDHLFSIFQQVLFYEPSIKLSTLTTYQQELYKEAEHIKNWERWKNDFSSTGYEKRRTCFKQICKKHSLFEYGKLKSILKQEIYRCVQLPTAPCYTEGFFTSSLSSKKSHSLLEGSTSSSSTELSNSSSIPVQSHTSLASQTVQRCFPPPSISNVCPLPSQSYIPP